MTVINQSFLFFLSAVGVFNGVLVAMYFFMVKPQKLANVFLGMMLLMLCIRIWKSIFFYFNPELPRIFLQLGLSAYFFVGPFLYFYVVEQTQSRHRWIRWQYQLSFLIGVVAFLSTVYPYQNHPEVWSKFVRFIHYEWLFCILVSIYVARADLRRMLARNEAFSNSDLWLVSVLSGNALIWIVHFSAPYISYISGALSFSFVFYLLALLLVSRRVDQRNKPAIKYADKQIPLTQASSLIDRLNQLMLQEHLHKNADLTLPVVAKRLGITTQALSQLLNDNIKKSFSLYMNEFRVNEAKLLLLDTKAMKMDDIATTCGFNSQSTFYAVFKKQTGTTPAKFRDQRTGDK